MANVGSFDWERRTGKVKLSDELYRIFGLDPETDGPGYVDWRKQIHPEDLELVDATMRHTFAAREPWSLVHRIVRPDGSIRTIESQGRLERDHAGKPIRLLGTVKDVSVFKDTADALAHRASHDPLTGLPNRSLFLDRLEHALARASRSHAKLAVLFLDMDDFKLVNDTLGHDAGDALLVSLTPRLTSALRPGDTVARFGGDEFVVLCEELADDAAALDIADRIARSCARPLTIAGRELAVTVSAGAVIVDDGAATPADVLRDADAAMYRAKALGKGRVEIFDETMRARLLERIAIESELRRAIKADEFRLYFQPVVSLTRDTIVGFEALVRWQHPERGLLEPPDFIGVAESTGLIVPIGEWVLAEACRHAAAWAQECQDGRPLSVAVNLSPRQVLRSDIAAKVASVLEETGLDPSLLQLEITETALLEESDASLQALRDLKRLGVRIVLDDFGTGYSSLSNLRRYTIDALKIDRSFIDGLVRDAEEGAIVHAVLSMAHALDVEVTAEGVETAAQVALLRAHGCDFAQGFLYSRPVPADELDEIVMPRQSPTEHLMRLLGRVASVR
jgi:diguanylate cyclase (GGDEF)-like protein